MRTLCMDVALSVIVLLTIVPLVKAVGRVPDGVFNSEEFEMDLSEAMEICDKTVTCAGITYHPHGQDTEDWDVYFHSFLPPLLNNTKTMIGFTHRTKSLCSSRKACEQRNLVLCVDPSAMSLHEAQELCRENEKCVAFSYPVYATELEGFTDIVFAGSIQTMSTDDYNWHTFVVNDASKAEKANADVMVYVEELEDKPYNTCCERVPTVGSAKLPTVAEVQRMDSLPRIPCSISKEDFQAQYEYTRTPVILEGCSEDWPARTEWTFEKLSQRFSDDNMTTWRSKNIDTPGEFDEIPWNEVVLQWGQDRAVYIFDALESLGKESIEDDYSTPSPMSGTDLYALDFPPGFGSRHWICVGERGSGTDPHMDPFGTDAWNTLISGHKWWVLYPQNVELSMVGCDSQCSPAEPEAIDWFTSIGLHAARTSFADGAVPIHILQKAGETIYVPNGFIHAVLNLDETVAITANYGSPGNLQKVWENAVRKGAVHHWVDMYETTFTDEEREAVMDGDIWPPYLFAGVDIEGDQFYYNGYAANDDYEYSSHSVSDEL